MTMTTQYRATPDTPAYRVRRYLAARHLAGQGPLIHGAHAGPEGPPAALYEADLDDLVRVWHAAAAVVRAHKMASPDLVDVRLEALAKALRPRSEG